MSAEVLRAGLAGLAIWWQDHPDVPRERIVATAVNAVWIGLERRAGAGRDLDYDILLTIRRISGSISPTPPPLSMRRSWRSSSAVVRRVPR